MLFQNMAFQADQKVKSLILSALGTDQLFRLLSDPDTTILMKTLGLIRNLLSNKPVRVTGLLSHYEKVYVYGILSKSSK